jgi:electron transport complex protein RnfD
MVFAGGGKDWLDGYTGATPLDIVKQNTGLTIQGLYLENTMFNSGRFAGAGWEWINLAFLVGGIYLLYKKIFTWHAPLAMLAALTVLSAVFYDGGSSSSPGSPMFHLLSGATMFGAFFIVTDPVSSAVSTRGRLIYGAGIGALVYIIRAWGNYPDAVAFAVLLMNFAAPFIDYYTLPRTYGHSKANSGRVK